MTRTLSIPWLAVLLALCLLPWQAAQAAEAPAAEAPAVMLPGNETDNSPADDSITEPPVRNPMVEIRTNMGSIIVELLPQEAPETVANFLGLATGERPFLDPLSNLTERRPFYDGLLIHRAVDGFVIQGGSPTGQGNGGPGYTLPDEINALSLGLDRMPVIDEEGYPHRFLNIGSQEDFQNQVLAPLYRDMRINSQAALENNLQAIDRRLRNMSIKELYELQGYTYNENLISRMPVRGVIAMANSGPGSGGSQFFITLRDAEWLAGRHTVFGRVREGMEVAEAIGRIPVDANSRPQVNIRIISVRPLP